MRVKPNEDATPRHRRPISKMTKQDLDAEALLGSGNRARHESLNPKKLINQVQGAQNILLELASEFDEKLDSSLEGGLSDQPGYKRTPPV